MTRHIYLLEFEHFLPVLTDSHGVSLIDWTSRVGAVGELPTNLVAVSAPDASHIALGARGYRQQPSLAEAFRVKVEVAPTEPAFALLDAAAVLDPTPADSIKVLELKTFLLSKGLPAKDVNVSITNTFEQVTMVCKVHGVLVDDYERVLTVDKV